MKGPFETEELLTKIFIGECPTLTNNAFCCQLGARSYKTFYGSNFVGVFANVSHSTLDEWQVWEPTIRV
jgi:hypothetical protein